MKQIGLIVLLFMLVGCATTSQVPLESTQTCSQTAIPASPQWYNSDQTYRLRHDGILRMGETTIPLTGFMVLDTRNKTAKVAMLTGLGIKLATLEVRADSYQVLSVTPAAHRIPHFLEQCATAIQHMFLTDFPDENSLCFTHNGNHILTANREMGTVQTVADGVTGALIEKNRRSSSDEWRVVYGKPVNFGNLTLPGSITLEDSGLDYSVTLQLNDATLR